MFNGKIDQIAFISRSEEETQEIKRTLGLVDSEWTEDEVVATGFVRGEEGTNRARLLFNYDTGVEVEILQYLDGPNYTTGLFAPTIGHIGIHANREGEAPVFPDAPIIQQVETQSHTNPFLVENGRRYRYTIYDTYQQIGVYLKVIERIEAAS